MTITASVALLREWRSLWYGEEANGSGSNTRAVQGATIEASTLEEARTESPEAQGARTHR